MQRQMVVTQTDCPARRVPSGDPVVIPKDQFVTLSQSLGGNYTIIWEGNMVRVDGVDAAALGLEAMALHFDDAGDGQVHLEQVWQAVATVYDPEIPVNLKELGLIYDIQIEQASGLVTVIMTLTAPACGMGPVLVADVKSRVGRVPNVQQVQVSLVFDPPWSRDMMSDEAQLETGLFF